MTKKIILTPQTKIFLKHFMFSNQNGLPQRASFDFFIKRCCHDIQKLKFTCDTKFSNLCSEEWAALKYLIKRKDKSADKGRAVVFFGGPTYTKKKLCFNFIDNFFSWLSGERSYFQQPKNCPGHHSEPDSQAIITGHCY